MHDIYCSSISDRHFFIPDVVYHSAPLGVTIIGSHVPDVFGSRVTQATKTSFGAAPGIALSVSSWRKHG